MKNRRSFTVIALALFLLIGCNHRPENTPIDYSKMKDVPSNAVRMFNPETAVEVENKATDIVEGRFLDDAEIDYQYGPYGNVIHGVTISTFQISSVYKGDFAAGDQIKVVEDYHIGEINGQECVYHLGNYYPSDVGKEYLLFLGEYDSGGRYAGKYYASGCEYGRYPVVDARARSVDVSSLSNSNLNLGGGNADTYRSIYEEVIAEYMS